MIVCLVFTKHEALEIKSQHQKKKKNHKKCEKCSGRRDRSVWIFQMRLANLQRCHFDAA